MFKSRSRMWIVAVVLLGAACNTAPPAGDVVGTAAGSSDPKSLTATVKVDGVDLSGFAARIGAGAALSVSDGAFTGAFDRASPALAQVMNSSGVPILLAVRPADVSYDAGSAPPPIEISPRTTAVALAYLTPFVTQDNATDERAALALIDSMGETSDLAGAVAAALGQNKDGDLLADGSVRAALAKLVGALITQVQKHSAAGRTIIQPEEASHVSAGRVPNQSGNFVITNKGNRHVSAVLNSDGKSVLLAPRARLMDFGPVFGNPPPAPPSAVLTSGIADTAGEIVAVYGLGMHGGLPDADASQQWSLPTALTLVTNAIEPGLKLAFNVDRIPDDVVNGLANGLITSGTLPGVLSSMQAGDFATAMSMLEAATEHTLNGNQLAMVHRMIDIHLASSSEFSGAAEAGIATIQFLPRINAALNGRVEFGPGLSDFSTANWQDQLFLLPFPAAEGLSINVPYGTPTKISLSPTNPAGFDVTANIVVQPMYGHILPGASATDVFYAPDGNFTGDDFFSYIIHVHGDPLGDTGSVKLHVLPPENHPPVALSSSVTVPNVPAVIHLLGTDEDAPDLTYHLVTPPAHGILSDPAMSGSYVTYYPNFGFLGNDSFQFKVNDGVYDSNVATVSVKVIKLTTMTLVGACGSADGTFKVWVCPADDSGTLLGNDSTTSDYAFSNVVIWDANSGTSLTPSITGVMVTPGFGGAPMTAVLDFDSTKYIDDDPTAAGRIAGGNALIDIVQKEDSVATIDFGVSVTPPLIGARLLQDFTSDTALLRSSLLMLTVDEWSLIYGSLVDSMNMLNAQLNGTGGVVVLMSKGVSEDFHQGNATFNDAIMKSLMQQAPIFTIGWGDKENVDTVCSLATETGGACIIASDVSGLRTAGKGIAKAIRTGMVEVSGTLDLSHVPAGQHSISGTLMLNLPDQILSASFSFPIVTHH